MPLDPDTLIPTSARSYTLVATSIGTLGIAWSPRGLLAVQLPESSAERTEARLVARVPGAVRRRPPEVVLADIERVVAHLSGELDDFAGVRIDLERVPPFARAVYSALRKVRPGRTTSYGELARAAGSPNAARAVGAAMAKNPLPIVVPCHRVLAAGKKGGGFSAHGGLKTKARILAIEGVQLGAS
ncbi:MAG: methylated-DNA--[protein]-cysteine S-methyltransferase [Planctomycetes bacterium]|nr:methylated-DNA--[protein]-cysteine S-methyltransferase [Planctomycetota bacterium]